MLRLATIPDHVTLPEGAGPDAQVRYHARIKHLRGIGATPEHVDAAAREIALATSLQMGATLSPANYAAAQDQHACRQQGGKQFACTKLITEGQPGCEASCPVINIQRQRWLQTGGESRHFATEWAME